MKPHLIRTEILRHSVSKTNNFQDSMKVWVTFSGLCGCAALANLTLGEPSKSSRTSLQLREDALLIIT